MRSDDLFDHELPPEMSSDDNDGGDLSDEVDERWLVSYADMMTLLFGLFVLLYSMSNRLDQLKKSAAKEFSSTAATPPSDTPNAPPQTDWREKFESVQKNWLESKDRVSQLLEEASKAKEELKAAQQENESLENELSTWKSKVSLLKKHEKSVEKKAKIESKPSPSKASTADLAAMTKQIQQLQSQNEELQSDLEQIKEDKKGLQSQMAKLSKQDSSQKNSQSQELTQLKQELADLKKTQASRIAQYERKLASNEESNSAVQEKQDRMKQGLESLQSTVQQLKAEKADAENQTATQAKKLAEYEKQIANQSAKISQMERKAKSASPFLGFVVSWSTQDHDIDLVVTDPSGKSFDYKRRSYPGHPGKFILDTRRGPGAEMWESHRLLPGLYKISYVFYNTYGNKQPATVLGSFYSAAGIFDLPKTQLNFDSKREQDFKIQVSEDGVVKVLP